MELFMTFGYRILNYGLSQGYVDHLTHCVPKTENKVFHWLKINAQLCIVIKSTITQICCSYETFSEVWEQVKLLYTNDTQYLYAMCQNLLTVVVPKRLDGTMAEYLGKLHVLYDFNLLFSPASSPSQELEQRSKFFMLLSLHGLPDDYSHVCDLILGSTRVQFYFHLFYHFTCAR